MRPGHPHGHLSPSPVSRRSHGAAGSSRVQVVVLAAARLRALHLDPLVTGSAAQDADQPTAEQQIRPCPGPRLHREGCRRVSKGCRDRTGLLPVAGIGLPGAGADHPEMTSYVLRTGLLAGALAALLAGCGSAPQMLAIDKACASDEDGSAVAID